MAKISFFRQERYDGGVRTGIGINDETVLHHFETGSGEADPALLWFVDLGFTGRSLPSAPEQARKWLAEHAEFICHGLQEAADRLQVGMDHDEPSPFRWSLSGAPRGVKAVLLVSGVRRLGAGDLATNLIETSQEWNSILQRLAPPVLV